MDEYGTEEWYLVEENKYAAKKKLPPPRSATLSAHIDRHGIDPEPPLRVA